MAYKMVITSEYENYEDDPGHKMLTDNWTAEMALQQITEYISQDTYSVRASVHHGEDSAETIVTVERVSESGIASTHTFFITETG